MELYKIEDVREYFKKIIKKAKGKRIVKICTLGNECFNKSYKYNIDTPLYIEFEDQCALIIEYYMCSILNIEYRKLYQDEIEKFAKVDCKDFFNRTDEVYDLKTFKLIRRETLILNYDSLKDVEVGQLDKDYINSKEDGYVKSDNTFNQISFILKNNIKINICPEDYIMDGYLDVWSNECNVNIVRY